MQAVTGQLFRRHIIANLAAGRALGQQVPDEVPELLVSSGDMRTAMQQRRHVAAVMLVDNQRVGLQDRLEPLASVTGVVSDLRELFEVLGDLALVPGEKDRLHVREVLVQRRPADAGLLGDLGHRHRRQPMFGHQRRGGVQVASRTARRCASIVSSHSLGTTSLYASDDRATL